MIKCATHFSGEVEAESEDEDDDDDDCKKGSMDEVCISSDTPQILEIIQIYSLVCFLFTCHVKRLPSSVNI